MTKLSKVENQAYELLINKAERNKEENLVLERLMTKKTFKEIPPNKLKKKEKIPLSKEKFEEKSIKDPGLQELIDLLTSYRNKIKRK